MFTAGAAGGGVRVRVRAVLAPANGLPIAPARESPLVFTHVPVGAKGTGNNDWFNVSGPFVPVRVPVRLTITGPMTQPPAKVCAPAPRSADATCRYRRADSDASASAPGAICPVV